MSEEKNSNVVIIQDNGDKKTNKMTGRKWMRGITKHKWCVLGTTLIVGVACLAGVKWGVNSITEKLTATYAYNLATEVDENNVERYINGKIFDYASVVSKARMQEVKDSNEEFAKINLDKIIKNNAISVTRNVTFDTDANDKNVTSTKSINYTINAKARYFPNKEVGKHFIQELIYLPLEDSTNCINSYNVTSFINGEFGQKSYLDKVRLLQNQYDEIRISYDELEDKFGAHVSGNNDGLTINQLYNDYLYSNSDVVNLLNSFYARGFVDYQEGHENERIAEIKNNADSQIVALKTKQQELVTLKDLLNNLQNVITISTIDDDNNLVKEILKIKDEISLKNDEINSIVKVLNWSGYFEDADGNFVFDETDKTNACYQLKTLDADWVNANRAYAEQLTLASEKLESERKEATQVFRYVYIFFKNNVSMMNSGYVEVKGSIHWAIGLLVGLIIGFVASSLIMAEYQSNKDEKENEEKK